MRDASGEEGCLRFFVHDDAGESEGPVHRQDADVRPTQVAFEGRALLATTGGWSGYVAVQVLRTALHWAMVSVVLFLLWRLLGAATHRSLSWGRGLRLVTAVGAVLLVEALVQVALGVVGSFGWWNYSVSSFGPGPQVVPTGAGLGDVPQILCGGLLLVVAAVLKRSAGAGVPSPSNDTGVSPDAAHTLT